MSALKVVPALLPLEVLSDEAGPLAHSRLLQKPVSPCIDMIRELLDAWNESLFISASLEPS